MKAIVDLTYTSLYTIPNGVGDIGPATRDEECTLQFKSLWTNKNILKITTKLTNVTLKWTKRKMLNFYNFPSDNCRPGADPGLVGPGSYTVLGALFKKKNTELGTSVNIYLELLPGSCEWPVQVRSPEA